MMRMNNSLALIIFILNLFILQPGYALKITSTQFQGGIATVYNQPLTKIPSEIIINPFDTNIIKNCGGGIASMTFTLESGDLQSAKFTLSGEYWVFDPNAFNLSIQAAGQTVQATSSWCGNIYVDIN